MQTRNKKHKKRITTEVIPERRLNGRAPHREPTSLPRQFQRRYDESIYFRAAVDFIAIMGMALAALFFFYIVLTW